MGVAPRLELRLATEADIPAISSLIDQSVRVLQAGDYSPAQLEGALGTVFGVDTQLIKDGTYFVIEDRSESGCESLVACGGWSKRRTLFGSDQARDRSDNLLDPTIEAAKIRAFFVHPKWARKGLATEILAACEEAASGAGFSQFELGATLTGERMYSKRGYHAVERVSVPLPNGATLPIIRMSKRAPVLPLK